MSFEKILLVAVVAALILGPANLPRYAEMLGRGTRKVKEFLESSKQRVKDETDGAIDDLDWKKLDPRQYDPRRIIAEALQDDPPVTTATTAAGSTGAAGVTETGAIASTALTATALVASERAERERNQRPAPFDSDAT
ncbi:twin-arginine translocase TatA/TatE family subunit [Pseudoclavibacter sp. 13-3]|uniref:twin-arginine translocase TatA/TatE family subunit n=1 Tax=Pseudoclavibacter sp. 13-3 TaxID=2901228 RepID=UPI001E3B27D3|nr:twin-arginine translocase TatA/TatE family subunit [Pseudoclavibacter sp. 13-3]MCD7102299.1 twin-arginine translocase TatA/TatE family subunit [Pseudoclavibacter sp. 13-3]